jgi:hypothetical protein
MLLLMLLLLLMMMIVMVVVVVADACNNHPIRCVFIVMKSVILRV